MLPFLPRLFSAGIPLLLCAAFTVWPAPARADFDLDGYLQHLAETRNLSYEGLVQLYPPADYLAQVPPRPEAPFYYDEIDRWLEVTDGELGLLQRHDFVVSQRWRKNSYGHAFDEIWHKDLPVFVSSDAILHAVHQSYDAVLERTERTYFIPKLEDALERMHRVWPQLNQRYRHIPELHEPLADVDVYLTVALSLLKDSDAPRSQSGNQAFVGTIRRLVEAERPAWIGLFNDEERFYDFSQFRPRGHYEEDPDIFDYQPLPSYFRAMMWLGRTELRLTPRVGASDVNREILGAYLLLELLEESRADASLQEIDRVLKLLVGRSDNVTAEDLRSIGETMGLEAVPDLLEPGGFSTFRSTLYAVAPRQLILSQILQYPESVGAPEGQTLPYAFLLMGQRFLVDSFATGQVVYPFVDGTDEFGNKRTLPDPLDALFALGNDAVLPFIETEIRTYGYATNLGALRWVMDHTRPEHLDNSLYQHWLHAIRTLGRTGEQPGAPAFMRTGAWQQEKMNTQLAAWAELRHDNLLYGKQSYTGEVTCSFPCTYVEPVPDMYAHLVAFSDRARGLYASIPGLSDIAGFFDHMTQTMRLLRRIALKELSRTPFTEAENEFLQSVIYDHWREEFGCTLGDAHDGWYAGLFYEVYAGRGHEGEAGSPVYQDVLVADIHTDPNPPGTVFHIGTGLPELAVVVAYAPGLGYTAYVGPVAAGYQHITVGFDRLTDSEWRMVYDREHPARPDWTFAYLADRNGDVRTEGRVLMLEPDAGAAPADWAPANTEVAASGFGYEVPEHPEEPGSEAPGGGRTEDRPPGVDPAAGEEAGPYLSISPNPIEGAAVISFRLPRTDRSGQLRVDIFDIRGARIRELYRGSRPSDLVHLRWDGQASSGGEVAAGVYYLRIASNGEAITRKLTVLR